MAGFSYHRTNVHSWSGRGSWLSAGRRDRASLGLAKHMTVLVPEEVRGGREKQESILSFLLRDRVAKTVKLNV